MTVQNQPHGPTTEQVYFQQQTPFYQILPLDVVRLISEYVITGNNLIEVVKNIVRFGRVDQCFHAISHEDLMDGFLKRVRTEWAVVYSPVPDRDPTEFRADPTGRVLESRIVRHGARL